MVSNNGYSELWDEINVKPNTLEKEKERKQRLTCAAA